jgi:hypothetical protein
VVLICEILQYLEERVAQLEDINFSGDLEMTIKELESVIDWIVEQKDK